MQTKGQLIYNDIVVVFILSVMLYEWNVDFQQKSWMIIFFVICLVRQIRAHKDYFKLKNRFY